MKTTSGQHVSGPLPGNRNLGCIQNNDIDNIIAYSPGKDTTPGYYAQAVGHLLDAGARVLAQNVGLPDAVLYDSRVATNFTKYLEEIHKSIWKSEESAQLARHQADVVNNLIGEGTDPLEITAKVCRERGVALVASYRMNSGDYYDWSWQLSDFGREHPDFRIPGKNVLDPAVPEVYAHRMRIFTEAAEKYDIDGIEFDFRRHAHMVSDPLENHTVLTKMVRDTRRMLDETARRKNRGRMLLGARVGASLDGSWKLWNFPGSYYEFEDLVTCRELGLDVKTWINEGLVDYICPSLFWPRLPGIPRTEAFMKLAEGGKTGIYPSVFPLPAWGTYPLDMTSITPALAAHFMKQQRNEICSAAMQCYSDGADGISTYNWFGHNRFSHVIETKGAGTSAYRGSIPYMKTELFVHRFLHSPDALMDCMRREPEITGDTPNDVDWLE